MSRGGLPDWVPAVYADELGTYVERMRPILVSGQIFVVLQEHDGTITNMFVSDAKEFKGKGGPDHVFARVGNKVTVVYRFLRDGGFFKLYQFDRILQEDIDALRSRPCKECKPARQQVKTQQSQINELTARLQEQIKAAEELKATKQLLETLQKQTGYNIAKSEETAKASDRFSLLELE